MNTQLLLYLPIGLYLISTLFYLSYVAGRKRIFQRVGYYVLCISFAVHFAVTVIRYFQAGYTPVTNLHESLSFFALCTAAFVVYLTETHKFAGLGSVVLPVITVMLIWAITIPAPIKPLPPVLQSFWLPIHAIFAFGGNAVFLVGFLVSVIYLLAERDIKRKRLHSVFGGFPSLETLDSINYRCMSFGFPFLTIGIITGSIWAQSAWGSSWSWDPKEIWSLITWIVYAILIHNRLVMGWRGRKSAYMMILGFVSVIVTFLGVNLFIGGLHSYI